ncbi:hypothetical protein BDW75DRAFT_246173 [Aspergillus navahoensis]
MIDLSRIGRWLRVLGPSQSLAKSATDVQDSFVNIERTSHELLAKSIDEIKGENKDLKKQILELRDQLTNSDKDAFEQTFRLGVFSEELQEKDLATYRQRLATDLELNFQGFQQLRGPHFDEFTSSGVYRQWDTSLQPRLLILSGRNFVGLSSPQSWLSWVAISTIERQRRSSAYCAYYIVTEQRATLYQVLPSILLQLIAKKKDMLRMDDQRDALRAELHEFQQSERSGVPNKYGNDGRTDVLLKIATRVVRFFSRSDEVYIIVDRADLCTDIACYDHRGSLVRALVQMVSSAHCRIKILVVIKSSMWDVKEHQDELRISSHDRVVLYTMDQNRLH